MKLEIIKLSELKPLEENVRKHSEEQLKELSRSLEQFGQTRAMVIDEDNNILIGNGMYFAMAKMGLDTVECYRMTNLNKNQKKKLILSDNRIYSLGVDDYDNVNKYVQDITKDGDFDIAGFDTYTLEMMTLSEEDNEEAMMDYGKITDENYTHTEEHLTPSTPKQTYTPTTEPSTGESVQPQHNNYEDTKENHIDEHKADTRKSVICPNCGEVIYID